MFVVGTVHEPQGKTFHKQAKLAFKSKAPSFRFKIAECKT